MRSVIKTGSGVYAMSGHTQSASYPSVLSHRAEWQSYQAIKLNFWCDSKWQRDAHNCAPTQALCSRCSRVMQAINSQISKCVYIHVPVDDARAVPAGPTVLNVLSGSVGMSSVEKHRDDISGEQNKRGMVLCLCVCVSPQRHIEVIIFPSLNRIFGTRSPEYKPISSLKSPLIIF